MSLARIALRIAAVEALRGRTQVGDNVLDSQIAALDVGADGEVRTDQEKPFIAVYTNAATIEGADLRAMSENGLTEIEFEMGIAASMTETNQETGESIIVEGLPGTDQAFEFHLDLVARQIADTLTDPGNEWAEVYRGLVAGVAKIEHARTASGHLGVRLAGRQIRITAALIDDPIKGNELAEGSPMAKLLHMLEGHEDPVRQVQGAMMSAAISGSNEPWERVRRNLGMTRDELLAVGLGPIAQDEDQDAPEAAKATLELSGAEPVDIEKDHD
ncbi:MAG: hypothetical protein ACK4GT_00115 [Pararhodobacter sp.]